jgi:DNA-binding MarR family transcriptional regulator
MEGTALSPGSSLLRESARLQNSLGELLRVLQYRDRDRACCYGLSVSQCHALEAFVREGPMTVTELGRRLYLEKSTASRLAKALLERDLVRRRAPKEDGRVVILQVTEGGQRLARRIVNDLADEYRDLLAGFDPEVRSALADLVDRLTDILSVRTLGPGPSAGCR